MAHAYIGMAGWVYPPWRGSFYPRGLRQADELAYAAERVTAIEINSTFRSRPTPTTWRKWHDATPDGFVFTVKAPFAITHLRRLRNTEAAVAGFLDGALLLGEKLGPILWQLPPEMTYEPEVMEAFLGMLPHTVGAAWELAARHVADASDATPTLAVQAPPLEHPDRELRHAIEPRSADFDDPRFRAQLAAHCVATVLDDAPDGPWPSLDCDTAPGFRYARLLGGDPYTATGYDGAALVRWTDRVDADLDAGRDAYVFVVEDLKVRSPHDAVDLLGRIRQR